MSFFRRSSPAHGECRSGWYKRFFAAVMARGSVAYEPAVADRKRALLGELRGDVVEIGPGTGPNLVYYASGVRWIGVEPNPHMHRYVRAAAAQRGIAVELQLGSAERLPVADASVDAVVSTLVLCSVRDLDGVLAEVMRVLRPGGRFVFFEHVAAPVGTRQRRVQQVVRPFWQVIADGCQTDRETWLAIERAGFAEVQIEHFQMPVGLVGPHIAGVAIR